MLLFYIRHGDPVYHPDSLTPLGHRQAEALSHRLAQFGIDRIFASSSERAIQTARPTCELLKTEPEILDWCNEDHAFRELSLAGPDGKRRWLFQDPAMRRFLNTDGIRALGKEWYLHPAFAQTKYAFGMQRIERETDALLKGLGYVHLPGENCYRVAHSCNDRIALFAHQGFGLAFLSCLLDIPYPQFSTHTDMGHTGMTVIEFAEEDGYCVPCMLQMANDSHLWRDGIPTSYQNRIRF